ASKLVELVDRSAVNGNSSGNGIVAVDTPEGSALEAYEQDASFVYPATWFTGLGADTKVEQSYANRNGSPLLAGHWRPSNANNPTNGPAQAAGQASVVSGQKASGAKSIVFGTSVFFRTHPKGGLSQAARGIFWAAPEGAKVEAPVPADATVKLSLAKSSTSYGQANTATVSVTGEGKAATGDVKLTLNGKALSTLKLSNGKASLNLSAKTVPGKYALKAQYLGSDKVKAGEATTTVNVLKATPKVSAKAAKSKVSSKKNASVKVTVALPGAKSVYATGKVQIKVGSKVLKTVNLSVSAKGKVTVKLPKLKKGKYSLKIEVLSNKLQNRAVAKTVKLRVS
ncbi:MAG: Ig-like domain repeat protein, partial [Actinobacteria bacterium]|nr:Ig-like domain repeat protein [Actinomycetota bacterium]